MLLIKSDRLLGGVIGALIGVAWMIKNTAEHLSAKHLCLDSLSDASQAELIESFAARFFDKGRPAEPDDAREWPIASESDG